VYLAPQSLQRSQNPAVQIHKMRRSKQNNPDYLKNVLTEEERIQFDEEGFILVKNAISPKDEDVPLKSWLEEHEGEVAT